MWPNTLRIKASRLRRFAIPWYVVVLSTLHFDYISAICLFCWILTAPFLFFKMVDTTMQPYDQNLLKQRCQRYEQLSDMDKYECTIEEREEYYRHIEAGTLLFAGVDYLTILHEAEQAS